MLSEHENYAIHFQKEDIKDSAHCLSVRLLTALVPKASKSELRTSGKASSTNGSIKHIFTALMAGNNFSFVRSDEKSDPHHQRSLQVTGAVVLNLRTHISTLT